MRLSFCRSLLPVIATHTLAMTLGYAAWSTLSKSSHQLRAQTISPSSSSAAGRTKANRDREGDRIRQLTMEQRSGDALLARIAGPAPNPDAFLAGAIDEEKRITSLISRANNTPPARDPAARARELAGAAGYIFDLDSEAAVAMLHWFRADPDAVIAALGKEFPESPAGQATIHRNNIDAILNGGTFMQALVREHGWERMLKYLQLQTDSAAGLSFSIVSEFSKAPDSRKIHLLKEASGDGWGFMSENLARFWPQERAEDLFDFAMRENNVLLLNEYVGSEDPAKASWLIGKMAGMTEEMKRELVKSDDFTRLLYSTPQADFSLRVEAMSFFADEVTAKDLPPDYFRDQAIVQDVARALNETERDWRYAFRHGEVTAEEVLLEIRKLLPQQDAASPDGVWQQVFHELAEENPQAALKMLDGLPEEERHFAALKAGRDIFNEVNPQTFYDFLQHVPAIGEGELWTERMTAWAMHTDQNHDRLGDAYVHWVEGLPPGLDRELASYNLLTGDAPLSAADKKRLSANVTDGRLRIPPEKIEFSVPSDELPE